MAIKRSIMNRRPISSSLLILASIASASLAFASETSDPQQKAREMIVTPIADVTASQQHMANVPSDIPVHVDPHQQASKMMHGDHRPATSMPHASNVGGEDCAGMGPQRRAQLMIVGT